MYRKRIVLAVCLVLLFASAASAQTALATAKGLAGKWDTAFDWEGHHHRLVFIFDVKGDMTPAPDVRVRFTGTYGSPEAPTKVKVTDGEIIGNQFAFTITDKKGEEWKEDQLVSVFTGTFEGNQIKMAFVNVEPPDPAAPNQVHPGPHRTPPPSGYIKMHVLTGTRIGK